MIVDIQFEEQIKLFVEQIFFFVFSSWRIISRSLSMARDSCLARVTAGVAVGGAVGGAVGKKNPKFSLKKFISIICRLLIPNPVFLFFFEF